MRNGKADDPVKRVVSGRPRKRTDSSRARILAAVETGVSLVDAARFGGITYQTLNEWRKADVSFDDDLSAARSKLELRMVALIQAAAKDPQRWQAAAWILERIFPDKYRRPVSVEHSGKNGAPIQTTLSYKLDQLSIEELRRLASDEA